MDKARIAEGLSLLVNTKEYTKRVKQITDIIDAWEDTPMLFGGALEPLNALIDVGLLNREALDKLLALAQAKRRTVPQAKRVDYQRSLMRDKRERLYKAVELEELVRGAPLKGATKTKYMRDTQGRWMAERNAYIAAKGNLSWKERNQAANEFWANVDAQLAKDLAEAKRVLEHPPVKRKRVVEVDRPRPVTALAKAFAKAKRK